MSAVRATEEVRYLNFIVISCDQVDQHAAATATACFVIHPLLGQQRR
jgi:hypothetical protein